MHDTSACPALLLSAKEDYPSPALMIVDKCEARCTPFLIRLHMHERTCTCMYVPATSCNSWPADLQVPSFTMPLHHHDNSNQSSRLCRQVILFINIMQLLLRALKPAELRGWSPQTLPDQDCQDSIFVSAQASLRPSLTCFLQGTCPLPHVHSNKKLLCRARKQQSKWFLNWM